MIKKIMGIFVLCFIITTSMEASNFESGDRWCAVGDSITHSGSYHKFINLYYATRFPENRIHYYNCGISGDTAAGVLRRINWDVLDKKPTVVSIMLGMNDVGIFDYGSDKNTPEDEKIRSENIWKYKENMRLLAEKFKAAGVRMIFITPSIYDQTSTMNAPLYYGGNDGLGECSKYVQELAREFDADIVDFHWPMILLNAEQQKTNPQYTLVGADRVHPGDTGHFVMAYLFLKDQGSPQYVSAVTINAKNRSVELESNCEVSDLKISNNKISFTSLEKALPFPVQEGAKPALSLVPFIEDLNQEILKIVNLKDGTYSLKIDSEYIADFSSHDLEKGINLALYTGTPQYKQALKVMEANDNRNGIMSHTLRNIAIVEYLYYPERDKGSNTLEQIQPTINKAREDARNTAASFLANFIDNYEKDKPNELKLIQEAEFWDNEMWKRAKPQSHKFIITKVKQQ